jgi:hypothetical protein
MFSSRAVILVAVTTMTSLRQFSVAAFCAVVLPGLAFAQAPAAAPRPANAVDEAAVEFFKQEGLERSAVMQHLSWLCDVYGPRLTGSTNLHRASQWAAETFAGFGYQNARLVPWGPFGRGWECDFASLHVVGGNPWPVIGYPKAWSPSLDGPVEAEVVHVGDLDQPALEALDLAGKVVLIESTRAIQEPFAGYSKRLDEKDLLRLADQQVPEAVAARDRAAAALGENDFRMGFQRRQKMLEIVQQKRPLAILDRAPKGEYGTVFVAGAAALPKADGSRARPQDVDAVVIPQFTIAVEHYNRMCRLLAKGQPVRMRLELRTRYLTENLDSNNVLADLPGSDPELREQVVMFGAHIDSWHTGTGASDNGCGSAVVLEAARLLAAYVQKSGVQPRRTIRPALWSGEEQGLLGSRAWVAQELGTKDQPKHAHGKLAGYFNLDNGTGRIRGVYLQGNEAVAPIFRAWLRPFHALGASTLTLDDTGGTDHLAFHGVGLPGFQFIQDPVSYSTRTHHSNMDNWDHAVAEDLQQAAVIMAAFVWQTAQRDEMLPAKGRAGS